MVAQFSELLELPLSHRGRVKVGSTAEFLEACTEKKPPVNKSTPQIC